MDNHCSPYLNHIPADFCFDNLRGNWHNWTICGVCAWCGKTRVFDNSPKWPVLPEARRLILRDADKQIMDAIEREINAGVRAQ